MCTDMSLENSKLDAVQVVLLRSGNGTQYLYMYTSRLREEVVVLFGPWSISMLLMSQGGRCLNNIPRKGR